MHMKDLTFDVKRLTDMMKARDKGYSTCFKTIKSTMEEDVETCSVGGL